MTQLQKRDAETAVNNLRSFLASDPQEDLAWTMLGHAYEDLNRDDKASAAYSRALEINPRRVEALTGMGILCRKEGEIEQALNYYEQALAINAKYAPALSSKSVICLMQKRHLEALDLAQEAYRLEQADPVIVGNLAIVCHYVGLTERRDQLTQEAKSLEYSEMEVLQRIFSGELTLFDKAWESHA
jgi:Tfp pilus assembly protein PilF